VYKNSTAKKIIKIVQKIGSKSVQHRVQEKRSFEAGEGIFVEGDGCEIELGVGIFS
jgi:hypothetical protein